MQNRPSKHRSPFKQKNHTQGAPQDHQRVKRKPFSAFLIDTGFWPLAFAGRCMQQFGLGAVVGFVLGAACVYGYAVVKPLPYAKPTANQSGQPTPPAQLKTVQLRGLVRDSLGRPVKEPFTVGVLAKQLGPVQNSEGSFALEVPQSNSYDVALWNSETVRVFNGFAAEQDGNGYRLQQALPFLQAVPDVATLPGSSAGIRDSSSTKPKEQLAQSLSTGH